MSRFRLHPTPAQQAVLRDHCAHARYVWNLAVEQPACLCILTKFFRRGLR